jgi:hypothetical protein
MMTSLRRWRQRRGRIVAGRKLLQVYAFGTKNFNFRSPLCLFFHKELKMKKIVLAAVLIGFSATAALAQSGANPSAPQPSSSGAGVNTPATTGTGTAVDTKSKTDMTKDKMSKDNMSKDGMKKDGMSK